ncbi:MAG: N-acetylmuramoyl-L-alanine amidase [Coriobacteriales bacterium]|nr:N-acetylmuramoyl-L-alanine amidase [Coriobacteriales bacterium]
MDNYTDPSPEMHYLFIDPRYAPPAKDEQNTDVSDSDNDDNQEDNETARKKNNDTHDDELVKSGLAVTSNRRWFIASIFAFIALVAVVWTLIATIVHDSSNNQNSESNGTAATLATEESLLAENTVEEVNPLSAYTVCIDAGHGAIADLSLTPIGPGAYDTQYVEPGGAGGVVTGRGEYEVTLEIALLMQQKLEAAGVNVVMVRTTHDVVMSSEDRARIANECKADIFIRLHADSMDDPSLNGFTTLIPGYNDWTAPIVEESARAAQIMHPIIIEKTGVNDNGIVERYDLAGFNFCEVPSVLYEMGYMSNPDEDIRLSNPEYQDLLAQSMCDAAIAYLESLAL